MVAIVASMANALPVIAPPLTSVPLLALTHKLTELIQMAATAIQIQNVLPVSAIIKLVLLHAQ